jgi:hypothetical protein
MNDIEAVQVHIKSSEVPFVAAHPQRRPQAPNFFTIVLTSIEPVKQILPPDPKRIIAYVQAGGFNVVLTTTKGDAQHNTSDPTYATPTGMVLPYGNTAPYPLPTTGEVWAASASYPAQVTVTTITEG